MVMCSRIFGLFLALMLVVPTAWPEDGANVLLFTKSTGFEHQPISEKKSPTSKVEGIMREMLEGRGMTLTASKDGGILTKDGLKDFDLVIFYTQGDFSAEGVDGQPVMKDGGMEALNKWIKSGGGFIGFHSATDTLRTNGSQPPTPYTKMIGASFRGHGAQFVGTVRVVDASHPTMASIPDGFTIKDEWYVFQQMRTDEIHVLALLDPGAERAKQKQYDIEPYPIVWCREFGKGRVYYDAMGHRMDVWDNETFLKSVSDAVEWALGEGASQAKPNYDEVVGAGKDD